MTFGGKNVSENIWRTAFDSNKRKTIGQNKIERFRLQHQAGRKINSDSILHFLEIVNLRAMIFAAARHQRV
jgi:hypothetical protein